MSKEMITIISKDGKKFEKEKRIFKLSPMLTQLLEVSSDQVLKFGKYYIPISLNSKGN
jgi:hypothetical protein